MTDHAATARSYSRTASAATKRAEAAAHDAQSFYDTAAHNRRLAAQLTARPSGWMPEIGYTPARFEADARSWERSADSCLRHSFHATDSAAHYRELAARYRELHARRVASLAS